MWELIQAEHRGALTALVNLEPKDLVLVSKDGDRVSVHSLLLALLSPLVAEMLSNAGMKTAISLPFPLSSLSALASMLQGRKGEENFEDLKEVAECLGISLQTIPSSLVKKEVQSSDNDDVQDDLDAKDDMMKEETMNIKVRAPHKRKRIYSESSSSESSDQDEGEDPGYVDTTKITTSTTKVNNRSKLQARWSSVGGNDTGDESNDFPIPAKPVSKMNKDETVAFTRKVLSHLCGPNQVRGDGELPACECTCP